MPDPPLSPLEYASAKPPSGSDQRLRDMAWAGLTLNVMGPTISCFILTAATIPDWLATVLFLIPSTCGTALSIAAIRRMLKNRQLGGLSVAILGTILGVICLALGTLELLLIILHR